MFVAFFLFIILKLYLWKFYLKSFSKSKIVKVCIFGVSLKCCMERLYFVLNTKRQPSWPDISPRSLYNNSSGGHDGLNRGYPGYPFPPMPGQNYSGYPPIGYPGSQSPGPREGKWHFLTYFISIFSNKTFCFNFFLDQYFPVFWLSKISISFAILVE